MCSLSGGVLLSLGDLTDDSWVGGQGGVGLVERVGRCRHKLSTVVRAERIISDVRLMKLRVLGRHRFSMYLIIY